MSYAKLTKAELLREIDALVSANEAWVDRCTDMEAQLAASRMVLQPMYQRFRIEDQGCKCDVCRGMRMLFEKPGGRTMVEEFREQRLALEEAMNLTACLLSEEPVTQGRLKRAVVWFAKLAGRKVMA